MPTVHTTKALTLLQGTYTDKSAAHFVRPEFNFIDS